MRTNTTDTSYQRGTPPKKLLWWIVAIIITIMLAAYIILSPDTVTQDDGYGVPETTQSPTG